jgi:broad specificity phosphatase PhoE
MSSARLVLVRHGETTGNVAKILDTALPGAPLTDRGVAQAKTFGTQLTRPGALICSTALRAQQTARHIGLEIGLEPQVVDHLYEVQLGELDGKSDEQSHKLFVDIFQAWHAGDLDARPPGGESGRDVLDRTLPVLDHLRERHLDNGDGPGDLVVVSHGSVIRLVARYLTDLAGSFTANNHLDNTGTVELLPLPDDTWECLRWGTLTPPFPASALTADDPMG